MGAMANLGYRLSDQTVGNILQRHGISPAPERTRATTWADFIRAHMSVLAGTDFFSVEVLTLRGLVTYYVLFFIHLEADQCSPALRSGGNRMRGADHRPWTASSHHRTICWCDLSGSNGP